MGKLITLPQNYPAWNIRQFFGWLLPFNLSGLDIPVTDSCPSQCQVNWQANSPATQSFVSLKLNGLADLFEILDASRTHVHLTAPECLIAHSSRALHWHKLIMFGKGGFNHLNVRIWFCLVWLGEVLIFIILILFVCMEVMKTLI